MSQECTIFLGLLQDKMKARTHLAQLWKGGWVRIPLDKKSALNPGVMTLMLN